VITHSMRNESESTPVEVRIPCGTVTLEGTLAILPGANGVVVFAHGSDSRHNPRNQFVARVIRESGDGTLLFDLLTAEEEIEISEVVRQVFGGDFIHNLCRSLKR